MKKIFILIAIFFALLHWKVVVIELYAQDQNVNNERNRIIDSLQTLIRSDKPDTNKVNHANKLCREYKNIGLYDTALYYGNFALQLAQQLDFKKGISTSYTYLGILYFRKGNYTDAMKNYSASLQLQITIDDKKGMAYSYNKIGNVYEIQGNYLDALKNQFIALQLQETIGNKEGIASCYNDIGLIYFDQGDYPNALKNYWASIKIQEVNGNKQDIATSYNNIGLVYSNQGNFPAALKNYLASLQIQKEIGNKQGIANSYNNIGNVHFNQGNYPDALKNYLASLQLKETIRDKRGIANSYLNIGAVYAKMTETMPTLGLRQAKFKEAEEYYIKAKYLSKEIGCIDIIRDIYSDLANLDSATGNYKSEIANYKMFIHYRDSLNNEQIRKKTMECAMQYEFDKKEIAAKAEQDKRDAIRQSEAKREKVIRYSVIASLALMFMVSFIIFRSLRTTRKQKQIIEQQKHLVEEHQKEIIDSINYAKRIQYALLASNDLLNKNLPEYFVLFKPKDIVSGDFYWATQHNNKFYLAVCDSTGHGVPGAFMSILNIGFLNEAIKEKGIAKPNEILNYVRNRLIETISKEGQQDGMDCILFCFENSLRLNDQSVNEPITITYAAAYNQPILVSNGKINELPKDKMPVGKGEKMESFTLHSVDCIKGDCLYLYTDGYADQFGGEKGKKFKYKPLNELLSANHEKSCTQQKEILERTFREWKDKLEQVDDVLVIGVRI